MNPLYFDEFRRFRIAKKIDSVGSQELRMRPQRPQESDARQETNRRIIFVEKQSCNVVRRKYHFDDTRVHFMRRGRRNRELNVLIRKRNLLLPRGRWAKRDDCFGSSLFERFERFENELRLPFFHPKQSTRFRSAVNHSTGSAHPNSERHGRAEYLDAHTVNNWSVA